MAKLVYAQDLKSCGLKNRVGPIPASGTPSVTANTLSGFTRRSPAVAGRRRGLAQLASAHGLGP